MNTILLLSPTDDRDYPYVPLDSVPAEVDLRPLTGKVEQQYSIGSCTANAVVSACEVLLKRDGKHIDLSRLFNYYLSREFENRLGQEGAYLRDAVKVAQKIGLPPERTWPYEIQKCDTRPDDAAYKKAEKAKISRYERIDDTNMLTGIKSALSEGCPVVFGAFITSEFPMIQAPLDKQNYQAQGSPLGGHAMAAVGYTPDYLIIENSWGDSWGERGYGAIQWAVVQSQVFEAWAVRSFAPDWNPSIVDKALQYYDDMPEGRLGAILAVLGALAIAALVLMRG